MIGTRAPPLVSAGRKMSAESVTPSRIGTMTDVKSKA